VRVIQKRWVQPRASRQLELDLPQPKPVPLPLWILRSDGSRWLVAASVTLWAGLLLHAHLALLLLPVVIALAALGIRGCYRQHRREQRRL